MTLKQAFTLWANDPKNITLAARYRQAMNSVLLKKHSETDVQDLTEEKVRDIFMKSMAPQEDRVWAANALVLTLQRCSHLGHCLAPTFDYTIGSAKEQAEKQTQEATPEVCSSAPPKEEEENKMKKKNTGGNTARKVSKIDPATLETVETYDSISTASAANGTNSLYNALKMRQKAGGYYWCYAEEYEQVKQVLQNKGQRTKPTVKVPKSAPVRKKEPAAPKPDSIFDLSDDDLINEMRRRGWLGDIHITRTVKL